MRSTTDLRGEKIIDSRDVLARFEELTDEKTNLVDAIKEAEEAVNEAEAESDELEAAHDALEAAQEAATDWDNEEEYQALKELIDQAEGYGDFRHGETLIRADQFEDYVRELAEDIGAIDRNASWPLNHIDWPAAADELKGDYTEVEFDGTTYLMRS